MRKLVSFAKNFIGPALALALPLAASAQIQPPPVVAPGQIANINQLLSAGWVCAVIDWIFWLIIVLSIVFTLVAAFRYLTAGGDPEKVKAAGSTLVYVVVAIIVALIAKGFPLLVSGFFGGGLSSVGC